jgi:hypothetical protein
MSENTIAKMSNPLVNYFRQPKIYITLPSKGEFYPDGALDKSTNGEYAVYAMTAKDELMFKTPDALLSGQATIELVKSCVPAIKDPWKMPSIDIDAVLIAIRIATYGDIMEINSDCPACKHHNSYELDLVNFLEKVGDFQYDKEIKVDPLVVSIRPYSYQEVTRTAIKGMEQQRILSIVNDETMDDEEKIERFGASFIKLTELTVDVIAGCITSIATPEGTVTDQEQIKEFINNSPTEVFNKVNDHITNMKNKIDMESQDTVCTECNHQFSMTIVMDQSNFFALRS